MAERRKTVAFNYLILLMVFTHNTYGIDREYFVFWPNGTVPFYVNPAHFDKEQSLAILSTLSVFTFKTCLQFQPVMTEPATGHHVLLFENPRGVRKCVIAMEGHAMEEPHRTTVGYECLRSPHLEQVVMKALGFPFEHNRPMRDLYIDVRFENIQPGFIPFFTKEKILPEELRNLPYDVNSVMHFGERDYSKNGHRSFVFKNKQSQQTRIGLSKMDYRKIEIIYGPECQKRDRLAKIDICKKYPSVRRKREIDLDLRKNLRINRDITPPPDKNLTEDITYDIKQLNIDNEIQELIERVHKISAAALQNERLKICNKTNTYTRKSDSNVTQNVSNDKNLVSYDIIKIIEVVLNHVKGVVNTAETNLTIFCDITNSIELYQRAKCGWGPSNRCPQSYKSTLPGPVKYSTKHRPIIRQSTKHRGRDRKIQYASWLRSNNDTQDTNNRREKYNDDKYITDNTTNKIKIKDDNIKEIETINSSKKMPSSNGTKVSSRRKRDTKSSNIKDLNNTVTDNNSSFAVGNYTKELNDVASVRRKRSNDTVLTDNVTSVVEKTNESVLIKSIDAVKESVVQLDKLLSNKNVNDSKDMLRMATRVFVDKKVGYAPIRRTDHEPSGKAKNIKTDREERGREDEDEEEEDERVEEEEEEEEDEDMKEEEDEKEKRKDNLSLVTDKRQLKKRQHKITTNREAKDRNKSNRDTDESRERPRKREKNRVREEVGRNQNKKPQSKRGKSRPRVPETVPLTKGNKEFYRDRMWPAGVVKYVIAQDSTYNLESMRARLEEVNDILRKKTCVRIQEVSDREGQTHRDFLVIDTSPDYVTGRVGGKQMGTVHKIAGCFQASL